MSPALTKGWQTRRVHVTVLMLSVDEAHLLQRSVPAALAQEPRPVYEPAAVAEHMRTYSPSTRARMSEADRRLQFRNRYLMMLKNDTVAEMARDLPWLVGYELAALGHALLRERDLLAGYGEAWALRDGARRRRRLVQERRRRSAPLGLRAPA